MAARKARRTAAALLAAALGTLWTPGGALAQAGSMEYAVKAAFLYKVAPFIIWPPAAFASTSSPCQLCVLGEDPFGASLDRAASGQMVDDHPVQVRRLQHVDARSGCHILYLGASRSQTDAEALRAVRGSPILTVADNAASGAIIRFVIQDNRVRFNVDAVAAAANRMTISSKLLSLALNVRGGG